MTPGVDREGEAVPPSSNARLPGWEGGCIVQILLPLTDNAGRPFGEADYAPLIDLLTAEFGGITAHMRAPAAGLWTSDGAERPTHDDVVLVEVMVDGVDAEWWSTFRHELMRRFRQDDVVVRAVPMLRL